LGFLWQCYGNSTAQHRQSSKGHHVAEVGISIDLKQGDILCLSPDLNDRTIFEEELVEDNIWVKNAEFYLLLNVQIRDIGNIVYTGGVSGVTEEKVSDYNSDCIVDSVIIQDRKHRKWNLRNITNLSLLFR
jgi:hypothetical protein